MRTISKEELKELYHKDFPLWAEINLELLREKAYDLVDWENLLEEIEDMARSDLWACVSQLARILEHMYKWDNLRKYTKGGEELGGLSWIRSVEYARVEIRSLFRRHPSLSKKLPEYIELAWEDAVDRIILWLRDIKKEELIKNIPKNCPYTYEETMTRDLRKEIKP